MIRWDFEFYRVRWIPLGYFLVGNQKITLISYEYHISIIQISSRYHVKITEWFHIIARSSQIFSEHWWSSMSQTLRCRAYVNLQNNPCILLKKQWICSAYFDNFLWIFKISMAYRSCRVVSFINNSKNEERIFLEIMKALGQKPRKFIIAPKMALHWHKSHLIIYSFRIGLIRGS